MPTSAEACSLWVMSALQTQLRHAGWGWSCYNTNDRLLHAARCCCAQSRYHQNMWVLQQLCLQLTQRKQKCLHLRHPSGRHQPHGMSPWDCDVVAACDCVNRNFILACRCQPMCHTRDDLLVPLLPLVSQTCTSESRTSCVPMPWTLNLLEALALLSL